MLFYALVNLGFLACELVWLALGQPFKSYLGEEALAQAVDRRQSAAGGNKGMNKKIE
jgi:hypothetical protein